MIGFELNEPAWWKKWLVVINEWFVTHFASYAPFLADGLVLTYPVFLVVWYLRWLKVWQKEMRYWALSVFFSAVIAIFVNFLIQLVVIKERPEWYIENTDLLIMDHLPTAPFPSDHAAVWMAVAVSTLTWWILSKHRVVTWIWVFLVLWSLMMSFSRVGVAIHWPTDVLVWTILWAVIGYVAVVWGMKKTSLRRLFSWIISVQEWVFKKLFWI